MNKITFKVSSQKDCSVASLIKEVNKISCRIYLDLENGYVAVENVNDNMIDSVIELVDNYYIIMGVEIDNTFEETTEKQVAPVVAETTADTTDDEVGKTAEVVAEKQPIILGPQSEDDLIIQEVEFHNKYIEGLINKLLRTSDWAMFKKNIPEEEIGKFIYTSMNEISMRYNKEECIAFSVGDVVDCNYGQHLIGEINGGHVSAIVCNVLHEGMAYVVPIARRRTDLYSHSYLLMDVPQDAIFDNENHQNGTVLVDKGKYVRTERFNSVIGRTTPAFFKKLLHQLASTFDFTSCLTETVEDDCNLPCTMEKTTNEVVEILTVTENTPTKVVETSTITEDTTNNATKTKTPAKKLGGEEAALLENIGFAFDKLEPSKKVEEQIESFLIDIGMTTDERMVTNAFVIACDINKINYENILFKLHEKFPTVKEEIIKNILKEEFKNWLKYYPTLAEKCPKISLMSMLRVFAKRFA